MKSFSGGDLAPGRDAGAAQVDDATLAALARRAGDAHRMAHNLARQQRPAEHAGDTGDVQADVLVDVHRPGDACDGGVDWPAAIEQACRGVGVSTVFQPILDGARGRVVGYEALTRFCGADVRDPGAWFAAARGLRRGAQLEAVALRAALQRRDCMPADCFLSVNVSPDLITAPEIQQVWARHGDLRGIVIELTEQIPVVDLELLCSGIERLRAAGAMIAVDDAGAGYAGLNHVLAIRPSIIKLDRELVHDVDLDEARRALIEMIGAFAARIDAWVLAEGIERPGELDALLTLRVPLLQGYFLGVPAAQFRGADEKLASRMSTRFAAAQPAPRSCPTLRPLLDAVPAFATDEAAQRAYANRPMLRTVVLLDELERPVALLERPVHRDVPGGPARPLAQPRRAPGLRVGIGTPIREVLLRAMTRESHERFDPILAIDDAGRYLGVLRIEDMVRAMAAES